MDDLTQALPWIGDCVNKIDVTNIGQQHDLIDLVRTEPLDLDTELKFEVSLLSFSAGWKERMRVDFLYNSAWVQGTVRHRAYSNNSCCTAIRFLTRTISEVARKKR